jgi:23S rRNA pseudouridine1911/1915/1917 synthase
VWKRLIEDGRVAVDGRKAAKPGFALKPGMSITATIPEAASSRLEGEDIPIALVYEDEHLAVVMKPAGLVVHPGHGARRGTLVHALLGRGVTLAPAGGALRPGIVHRLDKDTSGLLLIAKTDTAHRGLSAMFARRTIEKTYLALVWGRPQPAAARIDDAIGRSRRDPTKMTVRAQRPKDATTIYRTRQAVPGATLLEIDLVTGRTHQIRVHFAARRHPVIGDTRYGGAPWKALRDPERRALFASFSRLALHATKLAFTHPVTGERMSFSAPLPDDFAALVTALIEGA